MPVMTLLLSYREQKKKSRVMQFTKLSRDACGGSEQESGNLFDRGNGISIGTLDSA
jgi:hypothetical protein